MPRNGSGQYNPLTNTWNPPVTGVLATGADFQAQLNDISAAITQSVSKDGQTPMTANLPMGNNSIVGIASGTEISPSISANGDTNTGVYFPAADTVAIATGGVKRVEVDANGNVGVGVTPSAQAAGAKSIQVGAFAYLSTQSNGAANLTFGAYEGSVNVFNYLTTGDAPTRYAQLNGVHTWFTAPSGTAGNPITFTQAMTLTSDGNLLVGTTSGGSYPSARLTLSTDNGSNIWNVGPYSIPSNFIISQGTGGVLLNGTATSWSAISDERLKTELKVFENAVEKLSTLRAGTGRYLSEDETISRSFLLAQDVIKILPEAVDIADDEQKTLTLRYVDLIPLLVAGIQEQQALIKAQKTAIESLTARITALEAK